MRRRSDAPLGRADRASRAVRIVRGQPVTGGAIMLSVEIEPDPVVLRQWRAEFEAAARRPLALRMRYAFIKTYKPVLDDAGYRSFATMEDYRRWCETDLPSWLGYGRV